MSKKDCITSKVVSIIGLGYVGLPIAVAFAERGVTTIAFDINKEKVSKYLSGVDPTNEVGGERLKNTSNIIFTSNIEDLKEASFHIVAVPTPVNNDCSPNLCPIIDATNLLSKVIKKGDTIVYESTVYPGTTEETCIPILEQGSGLTCGIDFKVGYSPERINPGDDTHRFENIIKIVSGIDEESVNIIAKMYSMVVDAGVYRASSIKIAEAAKVIENSQRDINIAFINELAIIFDKMNIDTKEVLEAAGTKWNFLNFTPGLVGGHCIGVDPYYLTYKASLLGYTPEVILSGRKINDGMGKYIAEKTVKKMIEQSIYIKGAKVAILGVTFKENVPDIRNSKVYDIISELESYGIKTVVSDYKADKAETYKEYGVRLVDLNVISDVDAVIIAVAHDLYKKLTINQIVEMFCVDNNKKRVLIDVKGIYDRKQAEKEFIYWRL